jgi:hypothetical protein
MSLIKVNSRKEFLSKLIDVVILVKLPIEYSLRDREKEFLVNTILLNNEGYALESGEMVKAICAEMKIKNDDVYNYRNILKKKGWLTQTTDGLQLLMALDYSDRNIPEEIEFKFTLKISK